jgi:hypothetical protein
MSAQNKYRAKGAPQWLLARVNYRGKNCLPWPFTCHPKGYPMVGFEGRIQRAHRLMCRLAHGEPPTSKHQAAHLCGNARCINPQHLSWKTNAENQRDRRRHGTQEGGIGSRSRLTVKQIAEIQSLKGVMTLRRTADKFGVSMGCIEYWQKDNRSPIRPAR